MTSQGNSMTNYALRGMIRDLCMQYSSVEDLYDAIQRGTEKVVGAKQSGKVEWSGPAFDFVNALNEAGFGDLDIVFEYVIPGTTRRIDAVVLGQRDSKKYALIVEFKSWSMTAEEFMCNYGPWHIENDGVMRAKLRREEQVKVEHPLFQALSYRNFINNFHSAAFSSEWHLESICFLPGVTNKEFLYYESAPGDLNGKRLAQTIRKAVDDFVVCSSDDLKSRLEAWEVQKDAELPGSQRTRGRVMADSDVCAGFVRGHFAIPMPAERQEGQRGNAAGEKKAGNLVRKICLALAASAKGENPNPLDKRHDLLEEMLEPLRRMLTEASREVIDGTLDVSVNDKRLLIPIDCEKACDFDERHGHPSLLNAAAIALLLQYLLLRTGLPFRTQISMQVNYDDLVQIGDEICNSYRKHDVSDKDKLVQGAFDAITLSSSFSAINAYKWEPAVCTSVGLVDLCGKKDMAGRVSARKEAWSKAALKVFLDKSKEAQVVFLLFNENTGSDIRDCLLGGEGDFGAFQIVRCS